MMTNKDILWKVIQKVNKINSKIIRAFIETEKMYDLSINEHYGLIFDHDFAKAFFGENEKIIIYCPSCCGVGKARYEGNGYKLINCLRCKGKGQINYPVEETGWKYHLQQMVLEKEPLKYLEKYL